MTLTSRFLNKSITFKVLDNNVVVVVIKAGAGGRGDFQYVFPTSSNQAVCRLPEEQLFV